LAEVKLTNLPWKSFGLMLDLDRQIEQAFEELIHRPWGSLHRGQGSWPPVDIYETDREYLVVADLPGVAPTALELSVTQNELLIRGKRDVQSTIYSGQMVRIERERGQFERRIRFAQTVDPDRVESRCEHGQLVVRLIKQHPAKGTGTSA
jgi:HSP20 family protein